MKNQAPISAFFLCLGVLVAMSTFVGRVDAQAVVDVYIIAGQSNAANFAQRADTGSTSVGYNLDFARDRTVFSDPTHTDQAFSSSALDSAEAVTVLADGIFQGNDVAIFGFGRNGTAISSAESVNWFPGADPANGLVDNSNIFGDFVDWIDARLAEITASGRTPVVKGLFWFQGERDAVIGATAIDSYETNFENVAFRFREMFGTDLPIIATEIREGVAQNAALRDDLNDAVRNVAEFDPRTSLIGIQDLSFVSANDVHLNNTGYLQLAPLWSSEALALQSGAETVLQYDSDSNGDGTSTLRLLDSLTAAEFVTSADGLVSLGGNTTDEGQHATQEFTVSLGSGTDKFFRFGGEAEVLSGSLEDAVLDDGEWIGASFVAASDLTIDSVSAELFVNSSGGSSWAARDAGVFFRIGNSGPFTQFGLAHEGLAGDNGTIMFDSVFSVNAGEEVEWRLAFTDRTNVNTGLPATLATRVGSIRINASAPIVGFAGGTVTGVNATNHNHISGNFNVAQLETIGAAPSDEAPSVTESPFFALANPSGGLSGDLGFNNNPNSGAPGAPETATTVTLAGTFTIVGNSTAAGGFANGNGLPAGVTATYDISFQLSTTTDDLLSAAVTESNGLGAGNGDAFFVPTNGNFSGDLVFGAATITGVSFAGTPTDTGFSFANGAINSVDLIGIRSASFTGTNDAVLTDAAGATVVEFTTTSPAPEGEVLINNTNANLFEGQPLGDAILAVTNGGMHLLGFTLGTNFSYDITPTSATLVGDFNGDGAVDCDDVDAYIGNLGQAATGALADLDLTGDSQVTNSDVAFLVENLVVTSNGIAGTFLGDLNCDGTVNVLGDAFVLIGNLNNSVSSYSDGDINLDGVVNVLGDAFTFIGNLGQTNNP